MPKGDTKSSAASSYSYKVRFHETPVFHYLLIGFVVISLIVSAAALVYTSQLKKALVPRTIDANDFLKKLTAHAEMKAFTGIAPLNIIQINNNNLANLQSQISGIDSTYVGSFLIQYSDSIVVYDYDSDKIKGVVSLQQPSQAQLPADFFTKLNKHAELKGLEKEQPIGGQLDRASLDTLKQQFPEVYMDAKVGDFLLRYSKKLIIYDYTVDKIVNVVNLQ